MIELIHLFIVQRDMCIFQRAAIFVYTEQVITARIGPEIDDFATLGGVGKWNDTLAWPTQAQIKVGTDRC